MRPEGPYAEDLELALHIADFVDAVTLEDFGRRDLDVETKSDDSPVTEVDRIAEQTVRGILDERRPRDAVHGEEFGSKGGGARQWVIDPVDGTKNYIRGIPVWGTLLALLDEGHPVMGVVSAPALGMRWFAAQGDGAFKGRNFKDAVPIHVSSIDEIGEATVSYSSLTAWEVRGQLDIILDLLRSAWRTRAFGDFWSYMMVAEGIVEIALEPELEIYDMAALIPIVEEAGGRFTSHAGKPGPFGGNSVCTNGLLHDEVLRRIGTPPGRR